MYLDLITFFIFIDKNECLTNPCINNGTCINTDGSYTCICPQGWAGKDCGGGKFHHV